MVTEATPQTEAAATPTTEEAPPEAAGEQPFIEPEQIDPESGDAPLVQGTEDSEEGEAPSAEGEAVEDQKPEADTEESEEPAATLTREQHEEEVKKVQSGFDRRISELEKSNKEAIAAAEQRAQQAEEQLNARQLDIQAAQLQQRRAEHWRNQGHSDEVASLMAGLETFYTKKAFEFDEQRQKTQKELEEARNNERSLSSRQSAVELAQEHGVHNDDIPYLMKATSPADMEAMAKRLGAANQSQKELSELKLAQVPAGGVENKVDSGGGANGAMTDDQFLARYSQGLEDDHEKASSILRKRGDL